MSEHITPHDAFDSKLPTSARLAVILGGVLLAAGCSSAMQPNNLEAGYPKDVYSTDQDQTDMNTAATNVEKIVENAYQKATGKTPYSWGIGSYIFPIKGAGVYKVHESLSLTDKDVAIAYYAASSAPSPVATVDLVYQQVQAPGGDGTAYAWTYGSETQLVNPSETEGTGLQGVVQATDAVANQMAADLAGGVAYQ